MSVGPVPLPPLNIASTATSGVQSTNTASFRNDGWTVNFQPKGAAGGLPWWLILAGGAAVAWWAAKRGR